MPSAKADEVTIVQIESEGYNKQKVVVPICAMKGGSDYQRYVDLLVPHNAKLSLMQGEGPINLVGSHCVDYYGIREAGEGDSEDEAEEGTADEETEPVKEKEEEKKKTPVKEAKGDGDKKTPVKEDSGSKKRRKRPPLKKRKETGIRRLLSRKTVEARRERHLPTLLKARRRKRRKVQQSNLSVEWALKEPVIFML